MIICDLSQIAYAGSFSLMESIKGGDDVLTTIRSSVISSIKYYKNRFKGEYGSEIVVATDGNHYWRKEKYPFYKATRAKQRSYQPDVPWAEISDAIDVLTEEIRDNMPWKTIFHDRAEADDIMGILTEDVANRRVIEEGLYETTEKVLIISNDKDIAQVLKHPNVRQFSPYTKSMFKMEYSPKEHLRRLILGGDPGDSIPNIFSPSNSFIDGIRQKPCTEKKMAPFLEADSMLSVAMDDVTRQRLLENAELISFNGIPKKLRAEVVDLYNNYSPKTKMDAYRYLSKHRCNMLLDDIDSL